MTDRPPVWGPIRVLTSVASFAGTYAGLHNRIWGCTGFDLSQRPVRAALSMSDRKERLRIHRELDGSARQDRWADASRVAEDTPTASLRSATSRDGAHRNARPGSIPRVPQSPTSCDRPFAAAASLPLIAVSPRSPHAATQPFRPVGPPRRVAPVLPSRPRTTCPATSLPLRRAVPRPPPAFSSSPCSAPSPRERTARATGVAPPASRPGAASYPRSSGNTSPGSQSGRASRARSAHTTGRGDRSKRLLDGRRQRARPYASWRAASRSRDAGGCRSL